jgi:crooked neck
MEMKNKFVNHARNVWERAIYYLPREDQFWFKYAYMEELIGEYAKARDIFARWMEWGPGEKAWMAYIKFEERMGEPENAKRVLYNYLEAYPHLDTYIKVAKFEVRNRNKDAARSIFERVITELGVDALQESYFIEFAKFEIKLR